ncbi:hypothetical protein RNZ50_11690 [Paracoccaceae bacterium Fryx2]|nr:hypothetical protein [Paracoccaceae bacterium Fryx2]
MSEIRSMAHALPELPGGVNLARDRLSGLAGIAAGSAAGAPPLVAAGRLSLLPLNAA